jgi:hypothetical protein
MAPRARFELATLRLTAEEVKNLNALSGVAYKKIGAILAPLPAPNPAPKKYSQQQTTAHAPKFHSDRLIGTFAKVVMSSA